MRLIPLALAFLVTASGASRAADEFIYTVQPGDHPWNIALRYLKGTSFAQQLTRLNRITNDRQVPPGMQLRIPAEWLQLQSAQVRIVKTHGEITVAQPGQAQRAAVPGEPLPASARLRSGPRASAMLEFDDGSRVMVLQSTELRVVRSDRRLLDGGFMVELELLRGGLENLVTPSARLPETRFEIRTPAAVAAVRGTQFRVHADTMATWTEVLGGAVQVVNATGEVRTEAGFGTVARAGRAPEPPQPLLPAPDISGLPERLERLPIDLPLAPVPGALSYRTQVAPNADFDAIVSDEPTAQPRVRVLDIEDGDFVLRVRAIDADGLEGLASQRPIRVYARPQAPATISPPPGAVVATPRPQLRWTAPDPDWHYRLEIRRDGAADEPPLHRQSATSAHGTDLSIALAPGLYRWRVASVVPASGRQGPWGDAQAFRVVLAPPDVDLVQVRPDGVTIRWPALPDATSYDLQIATDTGFAQPLVSERVTQPQHALGMLAPGSYHLRVRAISLDGFAGPWGLTQQFNVPEPPPPPPPAEPSHWRTLLIMLPMLIVFGL